MEGRWEVKEEEEESDDVGEEIGSNEERERMKGKKKEV